MAAATLTKSFLFKCEPLQSYVILSRNSSTPTLFAYPSSREFKNSKWPALCKSGVQLFSLSPGPLPCNRRRCPREGTCGTHCTHRVYKCTAVELTSESLIQLPSYLTMCFGLCVRSIHRSLHHITVRAQSSDSDATTQAGKVSNVFRGTTLQCM